MGTNKTWDKTQDLFDTKNLSSLSYHRFVFGDMAQFSSWPIIHVIYQSMSL